MNKQNKLLVILGPTSSGKTKLAVKLAKLFSGEIISADSRQVYKGMDIGTGKDLQDYGKIPYHLIDIIQPNNTNFSVARYQKLVYQTINKILQKNKLPILAGGTGLYIDAVIKGYQLSDAKPNKKLRSKLAKKSLTELLSQLKKLDKQTFVKIDHQNKRRIIRALEIILSGEKKSKITTPPPYEILIIGIKVNREELNKRIKQRLLHRLEKKKLIAEVRKLHQQGVSWKRLESFGLEYRFVSRYLRGSITYDELIQQLTTAIQQFAKRQMTWFKRDQNINWIVTAKQAEKIAKKFVRET